MPSKAEIDAAARALQGHDHTGAIAAVGPSFDYYLRDALIALRAAEAEQATKIEALRKPTENLGIVSAETMRQIGAYNRAIDDVLAAIQETADAE